VKILRNVDIEKNVISKTKSEVSLAVIEFESSQDKNIKFECSDKDEARRTYSTASSCIRAKGFSLKAVKSGNDVYVVRK